MPGSLAHEELTSLAEEQVLPQFAWGRGAAGGAPSPSRWSKPCTGSCLREIDGLQRKRAGGVRQRHPCHHQQAEAVAPGMTLEGQPIRRRDATSKEYTQTHTHTHSHTNTHASCASHASRGSLVGLEGRMQMDLQTYQPAPSPPPEHTPPVPFWVPSSFLNPAANLSCLCTVANTRLRAPAWLQHPWQRCPVTGVRLQ